ncbi:hypothetical protein DFP73DRAFT_528147 [Morchella snyderi]|nr:hypothetical protein DFP73DRAFT_528147 [Morchella snyderi]
MRLLSFIPVALIFIISHLTAVNPAPNPVAEPLSSDEFTTLEKREPPKPACPYQNDCTCREGTPRGNYCWSCYCNGYRVITYTGVGTDDYMAWMFWCVVIAQLGIHLSDPDHLP